MRKLVVPTDKTARFVKHETKSQNVYKSKLSNIETRGAFKEGVKDIFTSKLSTSTATNLETNHNALIDIIKDASVEIFPKRSKTKKTKQNAWRNDPILLELIRICHVELRKTTKQQHYSTADTDTLYWTGKYQKSIPVPVVWSVQHSVDSI